MYCKLFNLTEPPFRLTPDPQFLYASKQHARAKAYMESTIWLADGFVIITGEIGSGKTTLIESFLSDLPGNVVLAQISQTQLTPVEFLQALLVEFGFSPFKMKKVELLARLKDFMVEQYASGKTLMLVVDEAQNLSRKVLEEVRLLSGIESQKEKPLRIILAGQPELATKLDSPSLQQLSQRVRLRFHLGALSKRESKEYIEHRLEIAGAAGRRLFADDAFDIIFRYTGGVPRLINILCDTAMLCAFAEDMAHVSAELVETAIEELQWVPFEDRVSAEPAIETSAILPAVNGGKYRYLEIRRGDEMISSHDLPDGRIVIGRTPDNDIQIASKFISRHHAQVTTTSEKCVLQDLNSTNGMFIDARRIKERELTDGDVIQLGEHSLVFRDLRGSTGEHVVPSIGDSTDRDHSGTRTFAPETASKQP